MRRSDWAAKLTPGHLRYANPLISSPTTSQRLGACLAAHMYNVVREEQLARSASVIVAFDPAGEGPQGQQLLRHRIEQLDMALANRHWPAADGMSLVEAVSTAETAVLVLGWEWWEMQRRQSNSTSVLPALPALEVVRSMVVTSPLTLRTTPRQHVGRLIIHEGGFI